MTTVAIVRVLAAVAAVGSGVLGGLYLAFSTAVLPALARRPPAEGAAAMREVNRVIQNPVFLLLFAGTAIACLLTAGSPLLVGGTGRGWRIAGGLVGLASFVSTAAINIPLNNRLERDAVGAWAPFLRRWTPSNHLRTLTSIAAAALLLVAVAATGPA